MQITQQKATGAYFTPDPIVASLVSWATRDETDRMLDPSCGDGRFLAAHPNSVGIEQDYQAAAIAMARAPWALVHEGDFFSWAAATTERFECAAGNPPFIRYQRFSGEIRKRALQLCQELGVQFSGLASSWAPFLVATAGLLKPGGRMAFVVPAEIGHAPYASPLMEFLIGHFSSVQVIAVREKLFAELSEDCWLLYLNGYGGRATDIRFTALEKFKPSPRPPRQSARVSVKEWRADWNRRLRPFLLSDAGRSLYRNVTASASTSRLGDLATINIGYVTGANDFFHLRPSEARRFNIPEAFLLPSVRNGRVLKSPRLTDRAVENWRLNDDAMLLLKIGRTMRPPRAIERYLDTVEGREAQQAYKCRTREPWYSVPDVRVPDYFLSYMSGQKPNLVRNDAGCTCTNSVHAVRLRAPRSRRLLAAWASDLTQLSCELEGHPLGGGLLKLEPGEAVRIALSSEQLRSKKDNEIVRHALETMRSWRHHAGQSV